MLVNAATASGRVRSSISPTSAKPAEAGSEYLLERRSTEGRVGLGDADELHVAAAVQAAQKAAHVSVHQPGDDQPHAASRADLCGTVVTRSKRCGARRGGTEQDESSAYTHDERLHIGPARPARGACAGV